MKGLERRERIQGRKKMKRKQKEEKKKQEPE